MANDFKSDGDKSTADTSSTSLSADASLKTDAKIESTATVQNTSDNGSEKSTGKRHILNIRVPKFDKSVIWVCLFDYVTAHAKY